MKILNKNPNLRTRRSGKGLVRTHMNYNHALSTSRRNVETENERVFYLPRRDKYGRIINRQFESVNQNVNRNIQTMRRR